MIRSFSEGPCTVYDTEGSPVKHSLGTRETDIEHWCKHDSRIWLLTNYTREGLNKKIIHCLIIFLIHLSHYSTQQQVFFFGRASLQFLLWLGVETPEHLIEYNLKYLWEIGLIFL